MVLVTATAGCGDSPGAATSGAGLGESASGGSTGTPAATTSTSTSGSTSSTTSPSTSLDPGSTGGADESSTGGAELGECAYPATDFGSPLQELDVEPGSDARLTFTVEDVPPGVLSATLLFDSYDADHPGEEGTVFVNGSAPYDLPANAAWDNMTGTGSIEVTADVVAGSNTIEFGAGTFEQGTFYRIGNVQLVVEVEIASCMEAPPEMPVVREIHYSDAVYTEREHWVHRCEAFDYAYTARGDEHIPLDCGGLYEAGGPRSGTATFTFEDVIAGTYEVRIRSRHTENRNPMGALFIVDGEELRIPQDDDADFTTDIWGVRDLEGDVDVVLDSTREDESDSVIWVRLVPQ